MLPTWTVTQSPDMIPIGLPQGQIMYVGKSNLQCRRLYSRPVDQRTELKYDQTVVLTSFYAAKGYPDKLRRIKY